jgi:hypothetical protein
MFRFISPLIGVAMLVLIKKKRAKAGSSTEPVQA